MRSDEVWCRDCRATLPMADGAPLIATDADALLREVRRRGGNRQPWFENDQLNVYDAGHGLAMLVRRFCGLAG